METAGLDPSHPAINENQVLLKPYLNRCNKELVSELGFSLSQLLVPAGSSPQDVCAAAGRMERTRQGYQAGQGQESPPAGSSEDIWLLVEGEGLGRI